jgi:hypothetical protein
VTDQKLHDALDGLFAYDLGSTDSGIHDEALRERVKAELRRDCGPDQLAGQRLSAFARRLLEPPRGLEDVAEFIRWLSEFMEIDL